MLHRKKNPLTCLTWIIETAVATPKKQRGNTDKQIEMSEQRIQLDFISILFGRRRKLPNGILEVSLAK